MENDERLRLARALLGSGAAGQAADISKIYPLYQRAQIDNQTNGGEPLPPFNVWAKAFMGQANPAAATQPQM